MIVKKYMTISVEIEVEAADIITEARRSGGGNVDRSALQDALDSILQRQEDNHANWNVSDNDEIWNEQDGFDELVSEAENSLEGLCDICKAGQCNSDCKDADCSCEDCPHEVFSCRYCGEECEDSIDLDNHQFECKHNPENFENDDDGNAA